MLHLEDGSQIGTDSRTRQHNRRLCPDRTTETDGNGTGYDGRPSVMPFDASLPPRDGV